MAPSFTRSAPTFTSGAIFGSTDLKQQQDRNSAIAPCNVQHTSANHHAQNPPRSPNSAKPPNDTARITQAETRSRYGKYVEQNPGPPPSRRGRSSEPGRQRGNHSQPGRSQQHPCWHYASGSCKRAECPYAHIGAPGCEEAKKAADDSIRAIQWTIQNRSSSPPRASPSARNQSPHAAPARATPAAAILPTPHTPSTKNEYSITADEFSSSFSYLANLMTDYSHFFAHKTKTIDAFIEKYTKLLASPYGDQDSDIDVTDAFDADDLHPGAFAQNADDDSATPAGVELSVRICPVSDCFAIMKNDAALASHVAGKHGLRICNPQGVPQGLPNITGNICGLSAVLEAIKLAGSQTQAPLLRQALHTPSIHVAWQLVQTLEQAAINALDSCPTFRHPAPPGTWSGSAPQPLIRTAELVRSTFGIEDVGISGRHKCSSEGCDFHAETRNFCIALGGSYGPVALEKLSSLPLIGEGARATKCPKCGNNSLHKWFSLENSAGLAVRTPKGVQAIPAMVALGDGSNGVAFAVVAVIASSSTANRDHVKTYVRSGNAWKCYDGACKVTSAAPDPNLVMMVVLRIAPTSAIPPTHDEPEFAAAEEFVDNYPVGHDEVIAPQTFLPTTVSLWNCRSLASSLITTATIAATADVCILPECMAMDQPTIDSLDSMGYAVFVTNRATSQRGGVAVLTPKTLGATKVALPPSDLIEACAIRITRGPTITTVLGLYATNTTKVDVKAYLASLPFVPDIVAGDFNARDPLWDNTPRPPDASEAWIRGRDLASWFNEHDFTPQSAATRAKSGSNAHIDIIAYRPSAGSAAPGYLTQTPLNDSDHDAFTVVLNPNRPAQQSARRRRIDWEKCSEEQISSMVKKLDDLLTSPSRNVNTLRGQICHALRIATARLPGGTPRRPPRRHCNPKDALLALVHRNPFAAIKRLMPENTCPPFLIANNGNIVKGAAGAALLAEVMQRKHALRIADPHPDVTTLAPEPPATDVEVEAAVRRLNGPDAVLFAHGLSSPRFCAALRHYVDLCFEGKVPHTAKRTSLRVLPKRDKSPFVPENLRPIGRVCTLDMITQRICARRLNERIPNPAPQQYGFTTGLADDMASLAIAEMSGTARSNTHREPGEGVRQHRMLIVAVDLADAYPSMPPGAVARAMIDAGAGGLARYALSAMSGRSIRCEFNGFESASFTVTAGVTQGGADGPTLWKIFSRPLSAALAKTRASRLERIAFPSVADDISIVVSGPTPSACRQAAIPMLRTVAQWAEKNGMLISTKSDAVYSVPYSSNGTQRVEWDCGPLPCGPVQIDPKTRNESIRVLGVRHDGYAAMRHHLQYLVKQFNMRMAPLRALAPLIPVRILRRVFIAGPLAAMRHHLHAVVASAPQREIQNIINTVQCEIERAARSLTGTVKNSFGPAAVAELGVPPARALIAISAAKRSAALALCPTSPDNTRASALCRRVISEVGFTPPPPPPPFCLAASHDGNLISSRNAARASQVHIVAVPDARVTATDSTQVKLAANTTTIDNARRGLNAIEIWTDGSVHDGLAGGALMALLGANKIILTTFIEGAACSFTAEAAALALIGSLELPRPTVECHTLRVFSDSRSVLSSLSPGPLNARKPPVRELWRALLLQVSKGWRIEMFHVFAHCDTPLSDEIDAIAGLACSRSPPQMSHAHTRSPSWYDDEISKWCSATAISETDALCTGHLRDGITSGPATWPDKIFKQIRARDSRLLCQLRTGACAALGAVLFDATDPCPRCATPMTRGNGNAVRHMFTCQGAGCSARRSAVGISQSNPLSSLWSNPLAAIRYAHFFLAGRLTTRARTQSSTSASSSDDG